MAETEAPPSPAAGGGGGEAKKPTAKELRMLERAKAASDKAAADAAKAASSGVYGELPLVQSREMSGRVWSRCVALRAAAGAQPPWAGAAGPAPPPRLGKLTPPRHPSPPSPSRARAPAG